VGHGSGRAAQLPILSLPRPVEAVRWPSLEGGHDLRTIQGLLGHPDVSAAMIRTPEAPTVRDHEHLRVALVPRFAHPPMGYSCVLRRVVDRSADGRIEEPMTPVLIATLPIIGVLIGAGLQHFLSRKAEDRRQLLLLRREAYADYLRAVVAVGFAKDSESELQAALWHRRRLGSRSTEPSLSSTPWRASKNQTST
jgi:hypothetical protein